MVFRNVLDAALIADASRHVDWLLERHPELRADELGHELARDDPFWYRLVSDPRLVDIAEIFIGPDVALFATHYICKEPGVGRAVPWHQDGGYWPLEPMDVVSLWLAVSDSTRANGCLKLVPGSHTTRLMDMVPTNRDEVLPLEIPVAVDERDAVAIELAPGDVSVHHPNIVHGSDANTSTSWRRGLDDPLHPDDDADSRCRDVCSVSAPRQLGPRGQRVPAGSDLRPGTPHGLPELSDAMNHQARRTIDKVRARLSLIEQKVYARLAPIEPFQFRAARVPGRAADRRADRRSIRHDSRGERRGADHDSTSCSAAASPCRPTGARMARSPCICRLGIAGDFSHPEALVYIDGEPYASCDRHHHEIRLPDRWCDGRSHELTLHGWTGGTTAGSGVTIEQIAPLVMGTCSIVQIDQADQGPARIGSCRRSAWSSELGDVDPIRTGLLAALDEAVLVLDTREPLGQDFYASVPEALRVARKAIAACGPAANVDITASGHAHIDVAWLWTVAQTRRKAGRTFHNALRLMDEFPDFCFTQSQPQLYDYVQADYPDLFESIKKRVAEGRWEPIGGMWVEADCNITGAEALVRQFMLGRTFFREHFGVDSPVLWLPDVFGYSWQLPQLIKSAGLEFFFTTKISWNLYNRLPYDSFWWQGLDGTRVLTHFSPTPSTDDVHWNTYNALAWPADVFGTWKNYLHSDAAAAGETAPVLMSYGWGDGGGGPTREMVENLAVMADFPGTPRVAPRPSRGLLRGARSTLRDTPTDVERGALPRIPPGHVHDSRGREASQPPLRDRPARRRTARRLGNRR